MPILPWSRVPIDRLHEIAYSMNHSFDFWSRRVESDKANALRNLARAKHWQAQGETSFAYDCMKSYRFWGRMMFKSMALRNRAIS